MDAVAQARKNMGRTLDARIELKNRTELLKDFAKACLDGGKQGIKGISLFLDEDRFCVSHRGDVIGTWRQAGTSLVFENALGELEICSTLAEAIDRTAYEIADHLPPTPMAYAETGLRL
jgi:hypothetical protein